MAPKYQTVRKQNHPSCDSLPHDILSCVQQFYSNVSPHALFFFERLKARVACVCVFSLHTAIIKSTSAQATFFKFV